MSTLSMLAMFLLTLQNSPAPKQETLKKEDQKTMTFLEVRNSAEGITFRMENGRVEVTVPAENKGKGTPQDTATYKAASLEEFKRLYPAIARKYALDQYVPKGLKAGEMEKEWESWVKKVPFEEEERFQKFMRDLPKDTPEAFGHLERWFDEEHRVLRDLERRLHEEGVPTLDEPAKAHEAFFGVLIGPVGETLRAQLGLQSHEGLVVSEVERASLAESSGVKKYDVLTRISGQAIEDTGHSREQMTTALQSKEFILELIRGGSHVKMTVHPAHS